MAKKKEKVWVVLEVSSGTPEITLVTRDEKKAIKVWEKCVIESAPRFNPKDKADAYYIEANKDDLVFDKKTGCYHAVHSDDYDCYLREEQLD